MQRGPVVFFSALALFSGFTIAAGATSEATIYPLAVHVYQTRWQTHPGGTVDGEGRANLFENGQPRGFDYTFHCSQRFRASVGWETYPARWRKRNAELELLVPAIGKPGEHRECLLLVVMKDAAYYKRDGQLNEEPSSLFKAWMAKHHYDPEHGKNQPTGLNPEP